MKRNTALLTAAAAIIGIGALATTATLAKGPHGYYFGQGYGPNGYGMQQMMQDGRGYGPGQMAGFNRGRGNCAYGQNQALDTPLTIDDVRTQMEQHLKWRGNDRLKVGTVSEKDDKTIVAEIVTVDDSLVRKIEIDKTTGWRKPVQ